MAVKIPELEIDGVVGEVYDNDAVHQSELADFLSQENIRLLIGNLFFPVGSIYITASDTNPAAIFGGTWESVQGRVIMGADGNHPVNSVGGSEDAIVPSHKHYISLNTADAGSHSHGAGTGCYFSRYRGVRSSETVGNIGGSGWLMSQVASGGSWGGTAVTEASGVHRHAIAGYSNLTGVDVTGKNNMPYVAYYIWRRTA